MTIDQARSLLADPPSLHRSRSGQAQHGGTSRAIGECFIENLSGMNRPRILETGSGLSTLLFCCLDPELVVSISPAPDLHERTLDEARARAIPTDALRFVDGRSEAVLPGLALEEKLRIDAAFIDGNHGWPAVFVDFCYANVMLEEGGLLFVDDIHIYAVDQLVCLLRNHEPHFGYLGTVEKTAVFRKGLAVDWLPDWSMQPFILANTATHPQGPIARSQLPPER